MAVIFKGTLASLLQGYKGMSIEYGAGTIGSAKTFAQPFLETPAIFVCGSSDKFVHAASSATTGFTPTASSATSSGSGTTCNYLAIGRGDKQPAYKQNSSLAGMLYYGACTHNTALTFPRGPFNAIPNPIVTPKSDCGLYAKTVAATGLTPNVLTGDGGAGTTGNYLAFGPGWTNSLGYELSPTSNQADATWVEIGTCTLAGAVTFAYPFLSTPVILCSMTSDGQAYAASSATTGFTPTTITLTGKGSGTSGVYIALGPKRM